MNANKQFSKFLLNSEGVLQCFGRQCPPKVQNEKIRFSWWLHFLKPAPFGFYCVCWIHLGVILLANDIPVITFVNIKGSYGFHKWTKMTAFNRTVFRYSNLNIMQFKHGIIYGQMLSDLSVRSLMKCNYLWPCCYRPFHKQALWDEI